MQTELKTGCQKTARRITGRSTRIRTLDPLVPNQVRYRAAPHSEKRNYTTSNAGGQFPAEIFCLKRNAAGNALRHFFSGFRVLGFHHYPDQGFCA